jgi:hypothetical protein
MPKIQSPQGSSRFSVNRIQSELLHINMLVSIEPNIYAGSIMIIYSRQHMEGIPSWP